MIGEKLWDWAFECLFGMLYVDREAYPKRRDYVVAIIKSCLLGLVLLALAIKLVWFMHQGITAYCQPQVIPTKLGGAIVLPASALKQLFMALYQFPIVKYVVFLPLVVGLIGYFYALFLANKILKLIYVIEAWAYYKVLAQVWKILHSQSWGELGTAWLEQSRKVLGI
jgi:hypothetical protein